MQKIATRVFICASVAFGIFGILMVMAGGPDGEGASELNQVLHNLFLVSILIILLSFALSVAGKYLSEKP